MIDRCFPQNILGWNLCVIIFIIHSLHRFQDIRQALLAKELIIFILTTVFL